MALILNIETATEVCSVCLAKDGKVIAVKESFEGKTHAKLLTVFIEELLKENKLKDYYRLYSCNRQYKAYSH